MPTNLPKIYHGVYATPADDNNSAEFSFDITNPNLKIFYDKFNTEFEKTYVAFSEIASWFYLIRRGRVPRVISASVIATLWNIDRQTLENARQKFDELKKSNNSIQDIVSSLSGIIGVSLSSWQYTPETFIKIVGNFSSTLALIYSGHKLNSIMDAQIVAKKFLLPFNKTSLAEIKCLSKNLAEYLTYRFEDAILKLSTPKVIERFSLHFVKSIVYHLTHAHMAKIENAKALKNILIEAAISRLDYRSLWRNSSKYVCYFSFFDTPKKIQLRDKSMVSYEELIFNSPISFVEAKDAIGLIRTDYSDNSKRCLRLTINPKMPRQKVISRAELTYMGFRPTEENIAMPKAKL